VPDSSDYERIALEDRPHALKETSSLLSKKVTRPIRCGSLRVNTIWNLVGSCLPLGVGLWAIPALLSGVGTDRFALLTLTWALTGYLGLLDLGMSRGLTNITAVALSQNATPRIPTLFWSGMTAMLVFSLIGTLALELTSPRTLVRLLNVPSALQAEIPASLHVLAWMVPIVVTTAGFRGFLEAYQDFAAVNAIRLFLGVSGFAAPMIAMKFSSTMPAILVSLMIARGLGWVAFLILCLCRLPKRRVSLSLWAVRPVLEYGGWITVTNVVSPIMTYLDRFWIGHMVALSAVTYYATPFEITSKLLTLPSAVTVAAFPKLSKAIPRSSVEAQHIYTQSLALIYWLMLPTVAVMLLFGREGLRAWLGTEFAERSFRVFEIGSVALLINSMAHVPAVFIQSAGRPDLNAKLHLCEIPVYLALLYALTHAYGLVGAATASLVRFVVDSLLLFRIAKSRMMMVSHSSKALALGLLGISASLLMAELQLSLVPRVALALAISAVSVAALLRGYDFGKPQLAAHPSHYVG
jgi:O-antigen/teichoic acid export membrane protein